MYSVGENSVNKTIISNAGVDMHEKSYKAIKTNNLIHYLNATMQHLIGVWAGRAVCSAFEKTTLNVS